MALVAGVDDAREGQVDTTSVRRCPREQDCHEVHRAQFDPFKTCADHEFVWEEFKILAGLELDFVKLLAVGVHIIDGHLDRTPAFFIDRPVAGDEEFVPQA